MQFNDLTMAAGKIYSRRRHDTTALAPHAVATCAAMIRRLRAGELRVGHGVDGLPPFDVYFGVPSDLHVAMGERVEHAGRIFCVAVPGQDRPFSVNLVLPREELPGDDFATGTLIAISRAASNLPGVDAPSEEAVMGPIRAITTLRPVLATAVIDMPSRDTVSIAADFVTCFAAALFTEDGEGADHA